MVEFIASFPIAIFSKIFVTLTLHTFWRKVWRITNEQRNIGNIRNRIGKIEEDRMVYKFIFQNRANINGLWVKKGDDIEGYKVVRVFSDGVVLKNDKEIKKIILKSKILKVAK